ncbi:MAG: hypothetical protein WCI11_14920 [Candidatus Methylumidiphilus sp.]
MNQYTEDNNSDQTNHTLTKAQYDQIVSQGTGYEPSVPVKRMYLPLRKKERLWGGVRYPGLFDYDPANDAGWFLFTVILEVISLGITYFLLEERISNSVLAISAICIFFLDFTFAYFHHKYKEIKCLIENQKRLFLPEMRPGTMLGDFANYVAHLDQKFEDNKNRKYGRTIFAILIWFLCLAKGGAFFIAVVSSYWFQLAVSDSKTPYLLIIFIIASYLWIAYNHLTFTGYFIAAWSHKRKNDAEYAEYKRHVGQHKGINERDVKQESIDFKAYSKAVTEDTTNPYLLHFRSKSAATLQNELEKGLKECKVQSHGIQKSEQDGVYIIYRYGLLTDDHLQQMINLQESQLAQIVVAMFGHKLQMQSGHFDIEQA